MYLLRPDTDELTDAQLVELYPRRAGLRMNFVTSLDGAVTVDGSSTALSTATDKRVFLLLRMLCDVLLVGAGTFRQENYRPLRLDEARRAWRLAHGLAEYPQLVVVSGSLALDPDAPAFVAAPIRPLIITHAGAPADRRVALSRTAEVLTCGHSEVDWLVAMQHFAGQAVLCEGGPHLMGALTAADAIDELCLTLSPVLAGPGAGRITAGNPTILRRMHLEHALVGDDTLMLRYVR